MSDTDRIESLETQVRTLKRMLFGVFGFVVVGGLLAATSLQSVPDVIKARSFQVVDDEGNPKVKLAFNNSNNGFVSVYNFAEKRTVSLLPNDRGDGEILCRDGQGNARVAINCSEAGHGNLWIGNMFGDPIIFMGAYNDDGEGLIQIKSPEPETPLNIQIGTVDGAGSVRTFNKEGKLNGLFPRRKTSEQAPVPTETKDDPPKKPDVPASSVDPSQAIDAMAIMKEFANNKLAADSKYKKMGEFVLTGKFSDFGEVVNSSYTAYPVTFLDDEENFEHPAIAVQGLSRSYLESLNKGDQVTVKVKFVMVSEMMECPVFKVVK